MIKVTAKGGALNGKTFVVPETATTIDAHHSDEKGHYAIKGKTATWTPAKEKATQVEPTTEES